MNCWEEVITDIVECDLNARFLLRSGHSVTHLSFDLHYCMIQFFVIVDRNPEKFIHCSLPYPYPC
jgi:hypothetical protein